MQQRISSTPTALAPAAGTTADVVVAGSGIGGLSAAATAARAGARVTVLEKLPVPGGSAALSAGMFWTASDLASLRRRIPLGDAALGAAVVEDYDAALAEIRRLGIRADDEPTLDVMTFGRGYSLDIAALLAVCADVVRAAGGQVLTSHALRALATDEHGAVRGAYVHRPDGTQTLVHAHSVILATGGFQGAPDLLGRHVGPNADRLVLRSNPGSVGDGLRAAQAVGAGGTRAMHSFYGHLLPHPLDSFKPADYLPLTQYHSAHSVLVGLDGHRLCDESLGDEIANQELAARPGARGVLVFDDAVRRERACSAPFPGVAALDRLERARAAGARTASAATLPELVDTVASWGVDGETLTTTLAAYAAAAESKAPRAAGVAMPAVPTTLATAPFHATEVQPSITFTFGGIPVSRHGEVLDRDGNVLPGLYAAGVDVGGLSNGGYAGGLAPSYITGRWAGAHAAAYAVARGVRTKGERA
ncbi:FAD-dependent oxidoreductase [Streptomyces sp. NPDC096057]|uniref:FAD-dependent oxidoreductase n=1 Tax=Streptomyces sp. NPDC096057 TaxID=3155543 RepID=UPI0033268A37